MELILLGTSAAYPTVKRASSGYLIRESGANVLVDMGNGVVRNLMRWIDPGELSAIVLTHLHQDHFIDIYPLYYYLAYHELDNVPKDVYAPEGARDFILQIMPPGSEKKFDGVYTFKPLSNHGVFRIGDIECESLAVKHNLPAFGLRINSKGKTIAYSTDTDFTEVLFEIATGSDIFVCEATKQADYKDVLHLTATQAGIIAAKSGVKKLVLTHIWPDFDPEISAQMAAGEYSGPIIIAEDNMQLPLGS